MTSDKELALAINRMENLLEVMKIKLKNAKDEKEAKQVKDILKPKPRGRPVLYKTPEELKEASQRYSKTHYLKHREKIIDYNKSYSKTRTPEQKQRASEYQKEYYRKNKEKKKEVEDQ